ncbi:MAG: hypothetical protein HY782_06220 [Chloroflexi bacterium]|nr:hypothetical protein [Chloroflexota bacterium]
MNVIAAPQRIAEIFSVLPEEDRRAILNVGIAFRRVDLEKRLVRSQSQIREFETKYNTTIDQLEKAGLPDDADYLMHEDYIEWHHWARVAEKTRKILDILDALAEKPQE